MSNLLFEPVGRAILSPDEVHRYRLSRTWNQDKPTVMIIGVNPSRADSTYNDATITRCINFARDWGYGTLFFGNLYSFRTPFVTQKDAEAAKQSPFWDGIQWPPLLDNLDKAITEETDEHLFQMMTEAQQIICAWGNFQFAKERAAYVLEMIILAGRNPYCLGTNKDGSPKHPLYLAKTTKPILYGE